MKTIDDISPALRRSLEDDGYLHIWVHHGKIMAIQPMLFTYALVVDLDKHGYDHRYCYHHYQDAVNGAANWIMSDDDEPSGYIKRKPEL